jgi:hypothetical protein
MKQKQEELKETDVDQPIVDFEESQKPRKPKERPNPVPKPRTQLKIYLESWFSALAEDSTIYGKGRLKIHILFTTFEQELNTFEF